MTCTRERMCLPRAVLGRISGGDATPEDDDDDQIKKKRFRHRSPRHILSTLLLLRVFFFSFYIVIRLIRGVFKNVAGVSRYTHTFCICRANFIIYGSFHAKKRGKKTLNLMTGLGVKVLHTIHICSPTLEKYFYRYYNKLKGWGVGFQRSVRR